MASSYGFKQKGVDLSEGPPKRMRDVALISAAIETPLVNVLNHLQRAPLVQLVND
jgi:hypothetical protein